MLEGDTSCPPPHFAAAYAADPSGLVDALELWTGRWQRVFRQLERLGTRLTPVERAWPPVEGDTDLARFQRALRGDRSRCVPAAGDGSLMLLRAATPSLLAEPTAALLAADATPTVVIRGLDPTSLDAALELQGLARQGVVSASRWRPALQVLRLALAVAFVPQDPRRVLELLTLGSGPFAGRSGRLVADVWCDRPGIDNALWLDAKSKLSSEERERLQAWIEPPGLDPSGTPRERLLAVAEGVSGWIGERATTLGEPSWLAAASQAQAFVDALHADAREQLDRPAIEQLLQDLTEDGSTTTTAMEQAGRIDHVDSPERLLVARDRVVWWGFVGEARPHRTVFRAAELQVLRRAGLVLPDSRLTLRARFDGLVGAVQATRRQLILVIPEQVAGEACAPPRCWTSWWGACSAPRMRWPGSR